MSLYNGEKGTREAYNRHATANPAYDNAYTTITTKSMFSPS